MRWRGTSPPLPPRKNRSASRPGGVGGGGQAPGLSGGQGGEGAVPAVTPAQEQVRQPARVMLELRLHLHHHPVLVELGEAGGDLSLAEGVVERVVDDLWRDPEAG